MLEPVNKKRDAVLDFHPGLIAELGAGFGEVGAGDGDVPGLGGEPVQDGALAQGGFEELATLIPVSFLSEVYRDNYTFKD